MTTETELFNVGAEDLRRELAADLARGGYVYRDGSARQAGGRYFDKYLVLSRPGLLSRSARLLAALVPQDCERVATTGVAAATLGTALSQETGISLLLGRDDGDGISFDGELFSRVKVLLLEDVVDSGRRALRGVEALEASNADVLEVACLLDRQAGGAQRLAEHGVNLRPLFTEAQLLRDAEARA
jgi:orotate phosphoribosyltransferase